jgi:hypothetical protein
MIGGSAGFPTVRMIPVKIAMARMKFASGPAAATQARW